MSTSAIAGSSHGRRVGAAGLLLSVYFYDPDGNLVEVSNVVPDESA